MTVPADPVADTAADPALPATRAASRSAAAPERWVVDRRDAGDCVLLIPPDLLRPRRFEIACALTVRCGDDLRGAWHALELLANGALQWRRRIASSNPGSEDGLDYRFSRSLAPGESLRLVLRAASGGVRCSRLWIEADEA